MIKRIYDCIRQILIQGPTKKQISNQDTINLNISENQIGCFCLSANVIKIIHSDNKKLFYRECMRHEARDVYFKEAIRRFFVYMRTDSNNVNFSQKVNIRIWFDNEYLLRFEKFIHKCATSVSFYKKIQDVDIIIKRENVSIWSSNFVLSGGGLRLLVC